MRSHYEVLGVPPTATAAEVRRAFRRAARRTHPDSGGSEADFVAVRAAWDALQDPARRASYDRWLLGHQDPTPARAPRAPAEEEPAAESEEETPWQRPTTGLFPTRTTVLGPVALSGAMLVAVLTMVGAVAAVVGGVVVVLAAVALVRGRGVAWVLLGAGVAAVGLVATAVLAPSSGRSATSPLLIAMCTAVFAAAVAAASYVQRHDRSPT